MEERIHEATSPVKQISSRGKENKSQNHMKNFQTDQFDEKAIFLCQFCGGHTCSQQDYRTNKKQPNAIQGLHSNWITQNILAMQRPSQRLIKQYSIYNSFKQQNINTILNLQQPGQHPYCGDGIIPTVGFSYIPEGFFAQNILFFNQSWEDMTATTFEHMMKIMNVFHMSLIVRGGKIAVHCHAGRGRTLLVICSWLIYHNRMQSKQTIDLAVQRRQGVLTRSSQRNFLHDFQKQLQQRWKSFNANYHDSFQKYIEWQTTSLLKNTQKNLKHTSYLHGNILAALKKRVKIQSLILALCFVNNTDSTIRTIWNPQIEQNLKKLKNQANLLKLDFDKIQTIMLCELLFDYYDNMPYTIINSHTMDQIIEQQQKQKNSSKLDILCEPAIVHDIGLHGIAVILDFISFCKLLQNNLKDNPMIFEIIFLRIAITLFSKKKFNQKIFNISTRQCNLTVEKNKKYINQKVKRLAKFLQELANQISNDEPFIDSLLIKIRKVDANLHYFTQNHRKQNKIYQIHEAKHIFSQAKLKKIGESK